MARDSWGADVVGCLALVLGPGAGLPELRPMLDALPGESEGTRGAPGLITGLTWPVTASAAGPVTSADGRWLLCFTGRLDNHRELHAELAAEHRSCGAGDPGLVLAAFLQWGESATARLRGDFAFALADRSGGTVYLARDLLGARPLYWSRSGGRLRVASQVKALVPAGSEVFEVPPGQHGWAEPDAGPDLVPFADLADLGAAGPPVSDLAEAAQLVRAALWDAIVARAGTGQPLGVVLTGGIDDAAVLLGARELHPGCVALSVSAPGRGDLPVARRLAADLGVRHEVVQLRPADLRAADVREAIRISELTEYGDIINAVISVPVFRRAAELGLGAVLTGDGCAELFGGYPMYERAGAACGRLLLHRIGNLRRTELQRLDRVSAQFGLAAGAPFLDLGLVGLSMRMPPELKLSGGRDQLVVRAAFAGLLPGYILQRQLSLLSHASGLHERARLYRPLFSRMYRSFGYDLLEPLRRDFSVALRQSGDDLDTAMAPEAAGRDYTALEHARDLAGAVRRNAPLLRRGGAPGHRQPHPAGA
jgi:asparagine synthase (glutamine-hydrolysing)